MLRADAAPGAPPNADTQLLVHGMAAGAIYFLEVMRGLTAFGPVVAPDLPGAGHTRAESGMGVEVADQAGFLREFIAVMGIRRVVLHGWSMGGMVSVLLAGTYADSVARLVLVNAPLPGPLTPAGRWGWRTLGRGALGGVRLLGGRAMRSSWMRRLKMQAGPSDARREKVTGGDLSRISPELLALEAENRRLLFSDRSRLDAVAASWISMVKALYIHRGPAEAAIQSVTVPTLVMWGNTDRLCDRAMVSDLLSKRPDWQLAEFEGAGHMLPVEEPDAYLSAVGGWYGSSGGGSQPVVADP